MWQHRTGREWKTFKHYEDIDEFMASSDKVNPRFVKETKANKQDCSCDDTDNILLTGNQDCGKKPEKRPATTAEGNSEVAEKTGKNGQQEEKGPKRRRKGSAAMTWSSQSLTWSHSKNPYIDPTRMTREFWSSPQISGRSSTTTPRISCVCVRKTQGHICFQKIGFNSVLLFQRKKKWRVYLIAIKKDILNELEYYFGH